MAYSSGRHRLKTQYDLRAACQYAKLLSEQAIAFSPSPAPILAASDKLLHNLLDDLQLEYLPEHLNRKNIRCSFAEHTSPAAG